MLNRITFDVAITGGTTTFEPVIDGEPLSLLASSFERGNKYNDPSGGYGGLPDYAVDNRLREHFLGVGPHGLRDGRVFVLVCDCGEYGCWSLEARVSVDADTVRWSDFLQPHRPLRDYSTFGPFAFDRDEYERALAVLPPADRPE